MLSTVQPSSGPPPPSLRLFPFLLWGLNGSACGPVAPSLHAAQNSGPPAPSPVPKLLPRLQAFVTAAPRSWYQPAWVGSASVTKYHSWRADASFLPGLKARVLAGVVSSGLCSWLADGGLLHASSPDERESLGVPSSS